VDLWVVPAGSANRGWVGRRRAGALPLVREASGELTAISEVNSPNGTGDRERGRRPRSPAQPQLTFAGYPAAAVSAITADSWPPCQASGDLPSSSLTSRAPGIASA
jgi:hypothetical protein